MAKLSHIEQLIHNLCPNGVPFATLDQVCKSSMGEFVHKDKQRPDAPYPVFNGGTTNTGYYDQYNTVGPKVIISARGAAGFVNKVEGKFWAGNSCHVITIKDEYILNWKYLYYALKSIEGKIIGQQQKGGGVPAVSKTQISELSIPLPPMAIQEEIVRIIDIFANLVNNIDEEIAARQRQLEGARESLFTNRGKDWKEKTLEDVGQLIKGSGILKSDFVEVGHPCIHYGQIHTHYKTSANEVIAYISEKLYAKCKKAQTGDLVIATTSEDVPACCKATAWLGKEDVAVSGDAHILHHNQDPLFMSYLFQTNLFSQQRALAAAGAKVTRVSGDKLKKFRFFFPPIKEQQAIAAKLDTIEAFIANLNEERTLRQQQYEYYRAKLISLLK